DARLVDLKGIHHQVLAQERHRDRAAHRGEEVEVAAEERLVGEHRDRGGAALGIGHRARERVEVRADLAAGGRAPLHLRDHARLGAAWDRAREIAQRGHPPPPAPPREPLGRLAVARGGELRALVAEDLVEDHHFSAICWCEAATSAASFARADPESRLSRARTRPSPRSAAAPAVQITAAAFSSTTSRRGPSSPSSTASAILAFSAASPPRSASPGASGTPSGWG